jgi:general secretion pathway protein M
MTTRMPDTAALRARWQALAPREQTLVLAASAIVAFALLWWLAVAPALSTLRTAPARHAALDAQLQTMLALQAEAQQLQSAPRATSGDVVGALRAALTQRLGSTAQLNVAGDRATVTLKGAPADALAQWLAQARSNARAAPVEARLARSGAAPAAAPPPLGGLPPPGGMAPDVASAMPRWDGTLVLVLPSAR